MKQSQSKSAYAGGIGSDLIHAPFAIRDSTLLDKQQNEKVLSLTYFLEYCLTFTNIISGALICTLEKNWFSTL